MQTIIKTLQEFNNLNSITILHSDNSLKDYNKLVDFNFIKLEQTNKEYYIFSITEVGIDILNIIKNKNHILSNIYTSL